MKVYTKTGDKGTTALIGGTRVAKNNVRLEAYGGVDELNSHLGMIRSYPIDGESVKQLIEIQNVLFVVGANLATDTTVSNMQKKLPCTDEDVAFLERAIDKMDEELPPLQGLLQKERHHRSYRLAKY
jgi:cob(I)alamin adenosyltransferase